MKLQTLLCIISLSILIGCASSQGESVYDSRFRPDPNGFSFSNYGKLPDVVDMTSTEMQRMFGDKVCKSFAGGRCVLTPTARRWMDEANKAMQYGHCEGMAVLSAFIYYDRVSPANFGGGLAANLSLKNDSLQREIAYWWVTQVTNPGGILKINQSPSAVLDTLAAAFSQGKNASEWWVIAIYNPDGTGGHTITPIAVDDLGNGTAQILVYDNNIPGAVQAVTVNRTSNTWRYAASANPDQPPQIYSGNASTRNLEAVSLSSRMGRQACQFCDEGSISAAQAGKPAEDVVSAQECIQIWLEGEAHLLITDSLGRRIGFLASGEFVNEIPNATAKKFRMENFSKKEPMYSIPAGSASRRLVIRIDGTGLLGPGYQSLMVIGPCFDVGAQRIWLSPGEADEMVLTWSPGCDDVQLRYNTTSPSKPIDLIVGINSLEADYEFVVRDAHISQSGSLNAGLDMSEGRFSFATDGNADPGDVTIMMRKVDEQGEQFFAHEGTSLLEGDALHVYFLGWEGEGSDLPMEIDHGGDGSIDERVDLGDDEKLHEQYYEAKAVLTPEKGEVKGEVAPDGKSGGGYPKPQSPPYKMTVYLNS